MTTAGVLTEFPVAPGSGPLGIAAAPDGALWFTASTGNRIGRITTAGVITEVAVPTLNGSPSGIAVSEDGSVWFTEPQVNRIGRISPRDGIADWPLPPGGYPYGITIGPDGAAWFTEFTGGRIGRASSSSRPAPRLVPARP
jgi:virginiamycin B lyase